MPPEPELVVEVQNRQRTAKIADSAIATFLGRASKECPPARESELTVRMVGDRAMRDANLHYRGKDSTTDVLSFPSGEPQETGRIYLGDLLISVPVATTQAKERGHSLARELKLLCLHGYLHLLGYDHEQDRGLMQRFQRRLEQRLLGEV